jgi:hypothetical protein
LNTPQESKDDPVRAPSKRVEAPAPGYEKPLLGTLAALAIGLEGIRRPCPDFRGGVKRLEARR